MDRKRRPWTKEEDDILRRRIKTYGLNNWSVVADGLPGRSGKSCSERWRIYLTPGVKRPTLEPFNEWETAVIYLGQQVHGNQWCSIARLLPGRTNTAIKNYWKTALTTKEHKRVANNKYIQQGYSIEDLLANPPSAQELAASAARRRKAAAAATVAARREAAAAAAAEADQSAAIKAEQEAAEQHAELQEQRATSSSSAAVEAAAAVSSGSMEDGNSGSGFDADADADGDADLAAAWGDYDPELCTDLAEEWDLSDGSDPLAHDDDAFQHGETSSDVNMQQVCGVDVTAACAAVDGVSSGASNAATPEQPLQQGVTAAAGVNQPAAVAAAPVATSLTAPSNHSNLMLQLPQQQNTPAVSNSGYYATAALYQPAMQPQEMMIPVAAAGVTAADLANQVNQQAMWQQQQQLWQQQQQHGWQQQQMYGWAPVGAGNVPLASTAAAGGSGKAANRGYARSNKKRAARESDSDSDDEEARAAAAAAAAAIASGAIQLNPNVHPAAAAAAAADAARAAARAAARKAAAATAASNRKKSKLQGSSAPAAVAGSGSSSSCDAPAGMDANTAVGYGNGSDSDECPADGQHGRQRRKAATAGLAKVMAAVHEDHMQSQDDQDATQNGSRCGAKSPSKGARHGGKAAAMAAANGGSAYTISGPEEPMSVYNTQCQQSQQLQTPASVSAPAAAPAASAAAPPALSIDDHLDDPIMMELYKHELSIAQAMGSTPTATTAPMSPTVGNTSTAVAPFSVPTSPRVAPAATVAAPTVQQTPALTVQVPDPSAAAAAAGAACGTPVAPSTAQTPAAVAGAGSAVGQLNAAVGAGAVPTSSSGNSGSAAGTMAAAAAASTGALAGVTASSATAVDAAAVVAANSAATAAAAAATSTSAATATPSAAPVLKRQTSGPMAAPASSACDSEGSVFTASSRTSITITSSASAPAAAQPAAAGVLSGAVGHTAGSMMGSATLKGTGLPAPAFEKGYFVTFTGANGQRQQVLVQPAISGSSGITSSSSDGGSCSSSSSSVDMMGLAHMRSLGVTSPALSGGASAGMTTPAGGVMMGAAGMHHMSMGLAQPGQGFCHRPGGATMHHNPVVAAMLSQSNLLQTSGNCPVLHATMAALSNQGACTCVYCVTSSSRKGMGPPAHAGGSAPAGATPAQLASMAMPPPRRVIMSGKPAAVAAAAAAAAMPMSSGALLPSTSGMMTPMGAALSNNTTSSSMSGYNMGMLRSSSSSQYVPGMTAFYASPAAPVASQAATPVATTHAAGGAAATDWHCNFGSDARGVGLPASDNAQGQLTQHPALVN